MSKDILQSVINNFDLQRFRRFLSEKNKKFCPSEDNLDYYCDDNFSNGRKLGELYLEDGNLLICAFGVKRELSERSGKKAQYNLGRGILKDNNFQQFNAGIFVFYDQNENFRFSLIYDIPKGIHRDWNNFRRFTYFINKDQTNKTFLQRIGDGDFSSLEKIKDTFSVEKVTKEFYKDIANWYFWAVQNVKFPKDAEAEKNGRNIAVIRLITRIIFIWFMRERGLVPKCLFDKKMLNNILKDTSPKKPTYYLAILQNLFFATLNTKNTERNFHRELGLNKETNPDYGDYNGYRYYELFKDSTKINEYFSGIPFLNGGLFECLDDKSNGIIVDGFSDNKKDQPQIPNYLFFSGELKADLNIEYGTKNKSYKVRGLIDTLSSYNFTIDENDLDDQEVALDPELLGRVFENLLASFNPETSTTARKATGSYYTPREIVNYMVTESLKQYFKTHLKDIVNLEEKLEELFSRNKEENPFNGKESERIVKLIESLRIVDPAVGSGAFPMGMLNKLVFILSKIDPQNSYWKKAQVNAVKQNVTDSVIREKLIGEVEKQFQEKNIDYGRKLFLIQKCIYGVDIQQIAVEIARLRFFISLLVNEEIDKDHPDGNWGIQPLPNLDFKLMQGNSLVEIISPEFLQLRDKEREGLVFKFKKLKEELFNTISPSQKTNIRNKIDELIKKLFEHDKKKEMENLKEKISLIRAQKRLFKDVKLENKDIKKIKEFENKIRDLSNLKIPGSSEHFEWHINFSEVFNEKEGFDIVIANPPYVGEKGHKEVFREVKRNVLAKFYLRKMDLFYFFFHLALNIGKMNSQIAYISTNYYLTADGARKLRQDLQERSAVRGLLNLNELKIFESALGQHNMLTLLSKTNSTNNKSNVVKTCITRRVGMATPEILLSIVGWYDAETDYYSVPVDELYDGNEFYIRIEGISQNSNNPKQKIINKIKIQGEVLGSLCDVSQGLLTGVDKITGKHVTAGLIDAEYKNNGVYILNKEEYKNLNLNSSEKQLLKAFFKNSDIKRYYCNQTPSSYVLYLTRNLDLKNYPSLESHIRTYEIPIRARSKDRGEMQAALRLGKWWVIFAARDKKVFLGPKIVSPQRSYENAFAYNEVEWFASADVYYITEKNSNIRLKYVLSLLNSKLFYLWFYLRGKKKGEMLELLYTPLMEVPIKIISEKEQESFIKIVDKIIALTSSLDYLSNSEKQAKVREYEKQIDQMVYKFYGLTPEEIEIVENKS